MRFALLCDNFQLSLVKLSTSHGVTDAKTSVKCELGIKSRELHQRPPKVNRFATMVAIFPAPCKCFDARNFIAKHSLFDYCFMVFTESNDMSAERKNHRELRKQNCTIWFRNFNENHPFTCARERSSYAGTEITQWSSTRALMHSVMWKNNGKKSVSIFSLHRASSSLIAARWEVSKQTLTFSIFVRRGQNW